MSIKLLDAEGTFQCLFKKLTHGWTFVEGNPDTISILEYSAYTPGTPKNADFEFMLLGRMPLFIARKTPELQKMLNFQEEQDAFDSLFLMIVHPSDKGMAVESKHIKKGINREMYIENYLVNLFKYLGIKMEDDQQ